MANTGMNGHSVVCKADCPPKEINDRNCPFIFEDGEALQCVDTWAEEKFYYLENYLNATWRARNKFTEWNNAVFLDLFAGPGKSIIRKEKRIINGGAFRAANREKAAFNKIILNDLSGSNCRALKKRIKSAEIYNDDANVIAERIVRDLKRERFDKYHFVFLDPFAPSHLKFATLKKLSELTRIDVMINFPIGGIRRNYKKWIGEEESILDDFLGTKEWRVEIQRTSKEHFAETILSIYIKQLESIGFPQEGMGLINEKRGNYYGPSMVS